MSGRARYATRLLVVIAIIGVVVGLGFVWRVSPAAARSECFLAHGCTRTS